MKKSDWHCIFLDGWRRTAKAVTIKAGTVWLRSDDFSRSFGVGRRTAKAVTTILMVAVLLVGCSSGVVTPASPVSITMTEPIGTATATPTATPTEAIASTATTTPTPTTAPTEIASPTGTPAPLPFDGEQALADVVTQVEFGPRLPGSTAHAQTVDWMLAELQAAGWEAEVQETSRMGQPVRNVIGRWGQGRPWFILGAHYDSRLVADNDPDPQNWQTPVPGANDGASGVAVLLELARTLPAYLQEAQGQVWLVFFDAEDNGRLPGWDWILGSRAFVESLEEHPDAAVIVDMIGDADLNIYLEQNSDPVLSKEIWGQAAALGYAEQFIPAPKYGILDDHTPFLEAGIPAADLIDFDYPYYHTVADMPDKISAESLKAVGDTLLAWLKTRLVPAS